MQLQYLLAAGLTLGTASARGLSIRGFQCQFFRKPPNSAATCESFAAGWGVSVTDFMKWNPGATCPGLDTSKEYCVIGTGTDDLPATTSSQSQKPSSPSSTTTRSSTITPPVTTSVRPSTTTKSSSFTTKSPTTTVPANGITTPTPPHPGMVGNCNKFVKVNPGDTCDVIGFFNGVGSEWVKEWNTGVGPDCRTLQADTYVCISIIGGTPTKPANGITTPAPPHPGMVGNCNKFVKVNPGDTCDIIGFWNGVGSEWVKEWNTGVGPDCRTLQVDTYVCIGVIGGTPTKPGNGITTPMPTQPGMVSNCNKFVKVNPGDTCDVVAFFNGPIPTENFVLWNTGVGGRECRGLQAGTWACIGVM